MSDTIYKFIRFLNKLRTELYFELLKTEDNKIMYKESIEKLKEMTYFFMDVGSIESAHPNYEIFNDFELLSELLEATNGQSEEKFEIIMTAIKSNIDKGLLNIIIDVTKDEDEYFIKRYKEILVSHRTISKSYFNKKNYNEKDIEKIILAIKVLGVNESITSEIFNILKTDLYKRIAKEKKKQTENINTNGKYSINEYYDKQKERKEIIEELNSYFNYEKMEAIRPLSTREKVHCVELLGLIGATNEEKLKFLKIVEAVPRKDEDKGLSPIAEFVDNYDKLKYYENSYGLQQHLKTIKDYLEQTFICDDEEYAFWSSEIKSELDKAMKWIPKTYEYELSKSKMK